MAQPSVSNGGNMQSREYGVFLSGWSFLLIFILFLCYVNSLMYNFPRYSLVAPKLTRPKCKGWLKSGNI